LTGQGPISRPALSDLSPGAVPGLLRALEIIREEARSFPGPEGSSAIFAMSRAIEREMARLRKVGAGG